MGKQQYALVPVERLKELRDLDGIDIPITNPKEIAEVDETIKKAEKEGKIKTYTKEQFIKKYGL